MGPVFISPVPLTALSVCWAVTGSTNNALTALSNLSHIDTKLRCRTISCWQRCRNWTDVSKLVKGGTRSQPGMGCTGTGVQLGLVYVHICLYANSKSLFACGFECPSSFFPLHLHVRINCRVSRAVRTFNDSLYKSI